MECPKDCPVLTGLAEKLNELRCDITNMQDLYEQNEAGIATNQATARQLASLPSSREVANARSLLQEAVIQSSEAQNQVTNSIGLLNTAIEANQNASEIMQKNCPGEPLLANDPANPGSMILRCANPAVYE